MRYFLFTILTLGIAASALAEVPKPLTTATPKPASASGSESAGGKSAKASNETVAGAGETTRCRTVRVTGSLVKKGKVCKTLAQWRQMTESGNDLARRLVEDGTSRPGGQ
jgi:hypothetical protein